MIGRRITAVLRSAPVTVALIVGLWVVGAATDALDSGPAPAIVDRTGVGIPTLAAGAWWTPVTSLLWCSGIVAYLLTSLLLVLIGPPAERRLGSGATAAVLVGGQIAGTLLGTGAERLGVAAGLDWTIDAQQQIVVGPGVGLCALAGVLTFRLSAVWRRRLRLLVILVPLVMMLYIGHLQGIQRVAAVAVGLLAGAHRYRRERPRPYRASQTETRILVALCVVGTAIGPLAASLYPDSIGPFNSFADLYFSHRPSADDIAAACEESIAACARVHAQQRFFDSPGQLMAALVPVLLVVLAAGLRRGLKLAWRISVLTELLWVLVLSEQLLQSYDELARSGALDLAELFAEALLLPVLMAALLLGTRHCFDQRLPRRDLRRLSLLVGGGLLVAATTYVGVGLLVRTQYEPRATPGHLIAGLPAELLPPAYGELLPDAPIARGATAQTLEIYCGLLFWAVALAALLLAFRRPVVHTAGDAARARALLVAHGGSTLSFIGTWHGNRYWFDEDGRAAVAYRVLENVGVASVALTTGDPFGEPEARQRAVAGFARYCDAQGWTPCFYSCTESTRRAGNQLGWRSLQVAEDTVVPLPELAFTGKKWQDVRTALNKAGRQGITAEWWTYRDAPGVLREQIRAVSREWVSERGLPEMGFTLGGLGELADPAVRLLVAIDAGRTVHGVTSWMPVYQDGRPVGWTLDFMRRRANGFTGVMEFLIASAALGFKEQGAQFVSLSGAPLARARRGEAPGALQRVLDWVGRVLEPAYGFRSLLAFKAKFQPEYRPMYMVFPDPTALAAITRAIGKAYLPNLTAAQGFRLLRSLTTAVGGSVPAPRTAFRRPGSAAAGRGPRPVAAGPSCPGKPAGRRDPQQLSRPARPAARPAVTTSAESKR